LTGYRSALILLKRQLENISDGNKEIFVGKESVLKMHHGLKIVGYGNSEVLKRTWTIFESGTLNWLINISEKEEPQRKFKPKAIKLKGNILIQFSMFIKHLHIKLHFWLFEIRAIFKHLKSFKNG